MPASSRKKKTQQNKLLFIFLSTFFITLITLIYLATAFTPKIDIEISDEKQIEQQIPTDDENMVAEVEYKSIDSRLKDIQLDDKYTQAEHTTSDIVENLKKMKEETIAKQMKIADSAQNEFSTSSIQQNQDYIKLDMPKLATPQHPKSYVETQTQAIKKTVQPPTKLTKVYVGSYREFDQAAIVQESLVKSSLVSSPFIKNLNGYYVIQVGSFSNQEAAQNVAELLISNGYSAKMVLE